MDSKLAIALISVSVGWILSQATEVIKSHSKKRKLKKALFIEFTDLARGTEIVLELCHDFRDNSNGDKVRGVEVPQPIKTLVFDNYYHEIYAEFSEIERLSIKLIYGHVANFNDLLNKISQENLKYVFIDIYSATLWLQASINQYKLSSAILISEDTKEVERVNCAVQKFANELR